VDQRLTPSVRAAPVAIASGYDPMPTEPARKAEIRAARHRGAYVRADWINADDCDPETGATRTGS